MHSKTPVVLCITVASDSKHYLHSDSAATAEDPRTRGYKMKETRNTVLERKKMV